MVILRMCFRDQDQNCFGQDIMLRQIKIIIRENGVGIFTNSIDIVNKLPELRRII